MQTLTPELRAKLRPIEVELKRTARETDRNRDGLLSDKGAKDPEHEASEPAEKDEWMQEYERRARDD